MKNPFSGSNWLWVLSAFYEEEEEIESVPYVIFDSPEDCFEKYPGAWQQIDKALYHLQYPPKIEKYKDAKFLQLMPVLYFSKKS